MTSQRFDIRKDTKSIDYKLTKYEDRKKLVDSILEDGHYQNYFDDRYKVNINSTDNLSDQDTVCNSLERMATYLLASDESKEESKETKYEYKFYNNEKDFKTAIDKEVKLDGMAAGIDVENVIHFLKAETRNYKKEKTQRILSADYERENLGCVLNDYRALRNEAQSLLRKKQYKISRYKITEIVKGVKDDMIISKDSILGVFGYKVESSESSVIDWDCINYQDDKQIEALLYFNNFRTYGSESDLSFIIENFYHKLSQIKLNKLQKKIINGLREDKTKTDIAKELGVTRKTVYVNIKIVVERLKKKFREED